MTYTKKNYHFLVYCSFFLNQTKQCLISTFTITRWWMSTWRWWWWWWWWWWWMTMWSPTIMMTITFTISWTIAFSWTITVSWMLMLLSILFSCFMMIIKASIRITTITMTKIITTRKCPFRKKRKFVYKNNFIEEKSEENNFKYTNIF